MTAEMTVVLTVVLTAGAGVVFVVVMLCIAFALWRRRGLTVPSPGDDRAVRRWLIGGGIVFPLLVLVPLLLYSAARSAALAPQGAPGAGELLITVEARLWWWRVVYRDPALGREVVTANRIHLPTGRAVTLALVSDDVIHSFWVPPLAGKVDMVPGQVRHLRLQADRPGLYRGQCAEFCGEQHAGMAIHVLAQPPAEFDHWLRAQGEPAAPPADAEAARGLAVFAERRCDACHAVRGLAPGAAIGPDLTHLASRSHLGAGVLPNDREALAGWIADPQHAKPGVRMPSYPLDASAMQALTNFLGQLH